MRLQDLHFCPPVKTISTLCAKLCMIKERPDLNLGMDTTVSCTHISFLCPKMSCIKNQLIKDCPGIIIRLRRCAVDSLNATHLTQ